MPCKPSNAFAFVYPIRILHFIILIHFYGHNFKFQLCTMVLRADYPCNIMMTRTGVCTGHLLAKMGCRFCCSFNCIQCILFFHVKSKNLKNKQTTTTRPHEQAGKNYRGGASWPGSPENERRTQSVQLTR